MLKTVDKINKFLNRVEFVDQQIESLNKDLKAALKKEDALKKELVLDVGAIDVISLIVEKINESSISAMIDLVNEAISFVFDDRELEVKHEIVEARSKDRRAFNLFLYEKKGEQVIKSNIRTASGEGIRVVVGLMIVIFYVRVTGAVPLIGLDEVVSSVADIYIENLFTFLKKVGEESDIRYLFVSHDNRIDSFIDTQYVMQNGVLTEVESLLTV